MAGEWWKLVFEKPSRHHFPERDAEQRLDGARRRSGIGHASASRIEQSPPKTTGKQVGLSDDCGVRRAVLGDARGVGLR